MNIYQCLKLIKLFALSLIYKDEYLPTFGRVFNSLLVHCSVSRIIYAENTFFKKNFHIVVCVYHMKNISVCLNLKAVFL